MTKTEDHDERLIDLDTVESFISCLARFGLVVGCAPSRGFTCCPQSGRCCSEDGECTTE